MLTYNTYAAFEENAPLIRVGHAVKSLNKALSRITRFTMAEVRARDEQGRERLAAIRHGNVTLEVPK